jgi:hypothetical protein
MSLAAGDGAAPKGKSKPVVTGGRMLSAAGDGAAPKEKSNPNVPGGNVVLSAPGAGAKTKEKSGKDGSSGTGGEVPSEGTPSPGEKKKSFPPERNGDDDSRPVAGAAKRLLTSPAGAGPTTGEAAKKLLRSPAGAGPATGKREGAAGVAAAGAGAEPGPRMDS